MNYVPAGGENAVGIVSVFCTQFSILFIVVLLCDMIFYTTFDVQPTKVSLNPFDRLFSNMA